MTDAPYKELYQCRLESIRISKGSYTLELEKVVGGKQSLFDLSMPGDMIGADGEPLSIEDGCRALARLLELDLLRIDLDRASESVILQFSEGGRVTFSVAGIGADHIAMVVNKLNTEWYLIN